ncbi:hypothetical protein [Archaeoglobus fulgidus]|uniref:Uncharacterized protein AF_2161 n=3 Tax=Archaeoglobus fulgidus TaxID=2234 RepID=Y2161_ARCFU|nr:hypothetical protein [Archaeoglobus fulgidus]O28121.1 RecName: Full=Uncharacterized protein AF_2161 [Archaeoglobus fulgidus DSM 4304]AAB89102.1 predicted coding region AF_2161 [Archaeoglobus fulgidus DSM 4304]AIG99148.1 hypothetical protein AFULGI_00024310 [Archaeoglobus fulgidus DSM 8774]KUJ92962.1 MAG: hypothetical protein XD40_1833 [Archaeoglobus fulgidus]KUK06451.1 MAG: Uncharacterized protein XD48_1324 [Archaeoglobus fulgidus]
MRDLIAEVVESYDSARLDAETAELVEKYLARVVLRHVFLEEELDGETEIVLRILKRFLS